MTCYTVCLFVGQHNRMNRDPSDEDQHCDDLRKPPNGHWSCDRNKNECVLKCNDGFQSPVKVSARYAAHAHSPDPQTECKM